MATRVTVFKSKSLQEGFMGIKKHDEKSEMRTPNYKTWKLWDMHLEIYLVIFTFSFSVKMVSPFSTDHPQLLLGILGKTCYQYRK